MQILVSTVYPSVTKSPVSHAYDLIFKRQTKRTVVYTDSHHCSFFFLCRIYESHFTSRQSNIMLYKAW